MWNSPKSALHQAAIDAIQPERDREVAKSRVAEAKLRRHQEALRALKEHEADRAAVLARTQRLRAERLAREAEIEANQQPRDVIKRRVRSSSKVS